MGAGQPTMPPVIDDQMSMPPMGGQEMPSEQPQEQGMSIEQDAAMLAEATIGRTGGDPQAAVAILDTAKAMLDARRSRRTYDDGRWWCIKSRITSVTKKKKQTLKSLIK